MFMLLALGCASRSEETPMLVQAPTLSKTEIVFAYGGYLWSVSREGGNARQLTTGGHESGPEFSPDGKWIAFTGEYDGNADAFVMAAEGGEPKRLTWHPGADVVVGWTPDSKKVLFRSARLAFADFSRGSPADVARRGWLVFAGCHEARLRAKSEMAGSLEKISRRSNHACVYREVE
jgi:dipeptidyl aminopeptidase/acylaminoacyl peptidase